MMPPPVAKPTPATFTFVHSTTGAPDQRYMFYKERNNSVETITIITSIISVAVTILTLIFMGYKHWKKTKRDVNPVCFLYLMSMP